MKTVEDEIQERGANIGPRITPQSIEDKILSTHFATAREAFPVSDNAFPTTKSALSLLTLCVLVLKNGFTIVGKSACASPENFNVEIGQRVAREDAVRQVWALEGYLLVEKLAHDNSEKTPVVAGGD